MRHVPVTWRRPWVVHGAYESDLTIHSRTTFWYNERTVTTQAGSLITMLGPLMSNENSRESKQDEFHSACTREAWFFILSDIQIIREQYEGSWSLVVPVKLVETLTYLRKFISKLSQQTDRYVSNILLSLWHTFNEKTGMGKQSCFSSLSSIACVR